MQFITLAKLAQDLNMSEKQIRRRLRRLIVAGKLVENEDFERAHYQNENHFIYMVDPQRFIVAAKLGEQATDALRKRSQTGTSPANRETAPGNQSLSYGESVSRQPLPSATPLTTREKRLVSDNVWLKGQITIMANQLGEYKGLLPAFREVSGELVKAKEELRQLGPGPPAPEEETQPAEKKELETIKAGEADEFTDEGLGEVEAIEQEAEKTPQKSHMAA